MLRHGIGRSAIGALAASAVVLTGIVARAEDAPQQALAATVIPVRSIDPQDADFRDLEPLADAIGGARIVLLGEPSHGAGAAFAAKARLIRWLHQRMGFDVVAWESGMHELTVAQASLRAGDDPVAAAQRGVLSIWSEAAEVRPLFEYAQATRSTARPLDMAGFDIQFTAPGASAGLARELREFLDALHDPALREQAAGLGDRMLAAGERLRAQPEAGTAPTTRPDLAAVLDSASGLLATMRANRAQFARSHTEARIALMELAIANLRDDSANVYSRRRADRPTGDAAISLRSEEWNRRDSRMAINLRWLLEECFRGRKIVVWAHNAHVMHAYFAANWSAIAHEPVAGGMTPAGALLARWPDVELYSIAFTTYDGEENWTNGQRRGPIAPAPAGSFEARMHELGRSYAFVDLRAAARLLGNVPLGPMSLRVSGYGPPTWPHGNDEVPDIAKAFDGAFFIDRMTPATPLK